MSNERKILFSTCVAHAFTHVYMMIFTPVLLNMQQDFGLSSVSEITSYTALSVVLFGTGALPAGWLGDRFGEKRLLVAFFFLTGLGGTVLGLAQRTTGLAAGMVLVGLGCSIFHPVGNALIAKGIRIPGKAMGLNGLWGSLGTAAGLFYAGAMTRFTGSWRWSYLALAPPMALFGLWLAATRIETLPAAEGEAAHSEERGLPGPLPRVRIDMLVLLLAAMTCGGVSYHLIITVLPTYAGQQITLGGLSPMEIGSYSSGIIYLIGGAGQVLAGNLVHHREGRGVYVAVLAFAAPLVFLMGVLHSFWLVALGGIMAIFVFGVQPIENVLLSRYSPPSARGLLFGMKFILAFGVGSQGMKLAGIVMDKQGPATVFTVAAAVTGLALLAAVGAWACRRPRI